MSHYELRLINPADVNRALLLELRDFFMQAIAYNHNELTVDDYIDSIMAGGMQLWVDEHKLSRLPRGIGVTRLEETPNKKSKFVRVLLYSNEGTASYLEQAPAFEDWCLRFGASEIEFLGRLGWKKALAPLGYKLKYVVMRKPLGGRV